MALLAIKLKNQIAKIDPTLKVAKLRNVDINGRKVGCSGFFVNPENGRTVYVNTEESCYQPLAGKVLMRYAFDTMDYSGKGGRNEWVSTAEAAEAVVRMLKSEKLIQFCDHL